jgi:hypothetical protein
VKKLGGALAAAVMGVLGGVGGIVVVGAGVGSGAGATEVAKVAMAGEVPHVPSDVTQLGAVPSAQSVAVDVTLAGQDPAGLAAEVAAVSTPGSPEYHDYLGSAQYAAEFGPSAAAVSAVSSALRAEGLTVGTPSAGSDVLSVHGSASTMTSAFGTPLEAIRLPSGETGLVNLSDPEVPAAVAGDISGVVGFDGLSTPHDMLRKGPTANSGAASSGAGSTGAVGSHDLLRANATTPQACANAASAAGGSAYTSTELAQDYGLSTVLQQGRTGVGQTIGIVEFEQFSQSDITAFESCYGLSNPLTTVLADGPVGGSSSGSGEAALDIELAAVSAPSSSIIVYEAPNEGGDTANLDLLNRIASDDTAKVVTTSWGECEADTSAGEMSAENTIFQRMAAQGQSMVAAAGDTGSEDCLETDTGAVAESLAVDDPGSQPDVLDTGGTSLTDGNVADQSVWNNCGTRVSRNCIDVGSNGAGGGGFSNTWPTPSWQPTNSAGSRAVPDLSYSADADHGVVIYYGGWTVFGGTSSVAPTIAGLLADTNQGCASTLGLVGPDLYANDSSANFTAVTQGNNDFTGTNDGLYAATAGFNEATGLGTPIEQNLAIALQGGDGCPSVASLSANSGPLSGGGVITITGGGLDDASAVNFGSAGTGQIISATETSLTVVPPTVGADQCVAITVTNPEGTSATTSADQYDFGGAASCNGYRFVASDGGIFDFGSAAFEGSAGNLALGAPIVAMASSPSGNGYWLVSSGGAVYNFGDAQNFGSAGSSHLNSPIVGMAATPDGGGYWLVASDGGIFDYGDAGFYGSTGGIHLNKPIVGMATTPDGKGYWLVASDGGIFDYGDAGFYGSTGGIVLNKPIVGMAATPSGRGYWLVASDGGIFDYGNAGFYGSTGAIHLNKPIVGMAPTSDGQGYWLVASDGGIFSYGDAQFYGSTGALTLNKPIVGMAAL